MNIIHLCSNYVATKVHENQILNLQALDEKIQQTVIVPHRIKNYVPSTNIEKDRVKYIFQYFRFDILKYFPLLKSMTVFFWILIKYRRALSESDTIYCHTLWSDGVAGYFLSLIFKKKLIVTVRSADVSLFLPKLIHYRWLLKMVVKRAERIIFISPSYLERVTSMYPSIFSLNSCEVIPNAVDSFWFSQHFDKIESETILFVGRFCDNKQLNRLYEAILKSKEKCSSLNFLAVGGTEESFKEICQIDSIPSWVKVIEYTSSKKELAKLYSQSAVMALPSINETFGLVYLEALSQRCPVIHLRGEGIDGVFPNNNNIQAVEYNNLMELSEVINEFIKGTNKECCEKQISVVQSQIVEDYRWSNIAQKIFTAIRESKSSINN